jgi:hypothetical protein
MHGMYGCDGWMGCMGGWIIHVWMDDGWMMDAWMDAWMCPFVQRIVHINPKP